MEIKRTFIQTHTFTKLWKNLGLNDADLRRLENELLHNPKTGDVIQGMLLKAAEKAAAPVFVMWTLKYKKQFTYWPYLQKMKCRICQRQNEIT